MTEAQRYAEWIVEAVNDPEQFPGDGLSTYDDDSYTAERFMIAGGGPTVYAWVISGPSGQPEYGLIQASNDDHRWDWHEIPDHRLRDVAYALAADAHARRAR